MAIYKIPIIYQSLMIMNVEADNLQEAVEKGLKEFLTIPDENYLLDSFEIDSILEDNYPDEVYSYDEVLTKI